MTASPVQPSRINLRRRPAVKSASVDSDESIMQLKKGETFHTPTSAPTNDHPVLNIRSLPQRCPTTLDSIFERLTLDPSEEQEPSTSEKEPPKCNIPSAGTEPECSTRSRSSSYGNLDKPQIDHSHESDSGLGSSVSSGDATSIINESPDKDNVDHQSAITGYISAFETGSTPRRQLGLPTCKQIERYVLVPLLKETKLQPYHTLVQGIPSRIVKKQIVCLRDLEKILLGLSPKYAPSPSSYLNFCEFTIQTIHTATSHLNDRDQRLPADRPYTNGYFLDLVSQVRRYASMIRSVRERVVETPEVKDQVKGREIEVKDVEMTTTMAPPIATLEGGLSKDGRPAELVVVHEGKSISMATGDLYDPISPPLAFKRGVSFSSVDFVEEEGVERSMARRKKNAPPMDINQKCDHCDKVFKRPCDLTKHEKTHSRPWKCPVSTCKYFEIGWPTEKECDRHLNDKHSNAPPLFKCEFPPCPYASKRQSNCKQHMEKAHGWCYVRSKSNARTGSKAGSLPRTPGTPATPSVVDSMSTPSSKPVDFATPGSVSTMASKPLEFSPLSGDSDTSPLGELPMSDYGFNFNAPVMAHGTGVSFDFDWSHLDQNLEPPVDSSTYSSTGAPYMDGYAMPAMPAMPPMDTQMTGAEFFDAPSKLSTGLSPGAQGDATLFTPNLMSEQQLLENYEYEMQCRDFTLYGGGPQLGMATGMDYAMQQPAGPQFAQSGQAMFPQLNSANPFLAPDVLARFFDQDE
ncbi:Zinc finger C2H2 [Penicillium taxi]|uniref:Zinc finger C2H2 n=1 Tax=Penicillium taxi TaxID=168475 RepID=UPI002545518C|nr:Zinc finger C2H2 [Penicillium taxi]KAJ5884854.1 Zinc finger C2H2 [Penicillium taxi]